MVPPSPSQRRFIYVDRDEIGSREFRAALALHGEVVTCHDLQTALVRLDEQPAAILLLDTATLLDSPTSLVAGLGDLHTRRTMALVTGQELHEFIDAMRQWGILQVAVKTPPVSGDELGQFLRVVEQPVTGFGLISWLTRTVEMYSVTVNSQDAKAQAIERVMNHFATCGFDVHDLYDVRLILEEIINNAFYHAFHTAAGAEKYTVQDFARLAPDESVRIEYGSDSTQVGFSVTDSAGSLSPRTVLDKLERQLNHAGVFDESGRGIYLSRLLASRLVINIERRVRTQVVVLFDGQRKLNRPKPFLINCSGRDGAAAWREEREGD